jgi:hydrogenase expression/formation protein HypC
MPVAAVEFRGGQRAVSLALVPEAGPGDWVLVHLGMALQTVDEPTALETLALLEQAGLLDGDPAGDGAAAPAAP